LGNESDSAAAQLAEFALRKREQIAALEANGAGLTATAESEKPEERQGHGAFTGAAFADQAQDLTGIDCETNPVEDGGARSVGGSQVGFEKRLSHFTERRSIFQNVCG